MGEFERALVQYERGTRVRKVTTVIIISLTMIIIENMIISIIFIFIITVPIYIKMQTKKIIIRTPP